MHFKLSFSRFFLIGVVFFMLPLFVSAQEMNNNPAESVGLAINQSIISLDADPGKTVDFKITVENISKNEQKISVYAQDFFIGDNNEVQILPNANELNGMKDWIKIEESGLILQPGEKKEEYFLINVPSDATVGSHYTGLFFQAFPQVDAQNFQKTIVSGRVGSHILLNVNGDVSGKGNLKSFKTPFLASKKEKITVEFENTGNIFYIPNGEIRVKNLLTRQEKKLEVPKHFVFPGKKYSFDINWNPESVLGAYRANAYFIDGNKEVHVAQRFIFGKLFFVVLVIAIIIALIIFWFFKKRKLLNEKLPMANDESTSK